jgi:hypothetical protein
MSNGASKGRGLRIVLVAGTGLTLSISAQAIAQITTASPAMNYEAFRRAVLDGSVELSARGQSSDGMEKMQDFSDAFNQKWNKADQPV